MSRAENWVRMPKESAAAWSTFGFYEQSVGRMLLIHLDGYAGPVPGVLEASVARMLCGSVGDGNERRRIRAAVKRLQDAGLVFEHEGQIYVLYEHRQWVKYRELGERIAKERAEAKLPPAGAVPEAVTKRQRRPANDNAKSCSRRVLTVSSPCTHFELSSENHSKQRVREREIFKRSAARSGGEPPSAASPAPVIPIKKAKRAPRAQTPLDRARAQVLAVFNRHYAPRHGGAQAWVGYNLLTPLARCFMTASGEFQADVFERVVLGFLADPYWGRDLGKGPRGYGLDVLAFHHSRYNAAAPHIPDEGALDYGF